MSVGAGDFREFVLNGEHTGRVRLCVEFTIKPDKLDAFKAEFQKCIDISVKEKGCDQVNHAKILSSNQTLVRNYVWLQVPEHRMATRRLENQGRSQGPHARPTVLSDILKPTEGNDSV